MALHSMTGFARAVGETNGWRHVWELKTVNAKGLDTRLRIGPPVEMIGEEARRRVAAVVKRGTVSVTLSLTREGGHSGARIDEGLLRQLITIGKRHARASGLAPPTLDGLLQVRGVVEVVDAIDNEAAVAALAEALLASLDRAIADLAAMRAGEGAALRRVLGERLDEIARLTQAAEDSPRRRPEAVRARLAETIQALVGAQQGLDPARLHQEAVLIAGKADIREELDRLVAHVAACRALLAEGGPVGRRLDFLAQELSREANTLCAKAADVTLTAIGLDLKGVVEQFREQVQNVE